MQEKPRYLTEKEASRITGIPIQTLRNLRCYGRGPRICRPTGLRIVRYREDDLRAFMENEG